MKEEEVGAREDKIKGLIRDFPWKEIYVTEFGMKGLNAFKFFKVFDTTTEINYNRGKYKGFINYFKSSVGQTDLELGEWTPNVN